MLNLEKEPAKIAFRLEDGTILEFEDVLSSLNEMLKDLLGEINYH